MGKFTAVHTEFLTKIHDTINQHTLWGCSEFNESPLFLQIIPAAFSFIYVPCLCSNILVVLHLPTHQAINANGCLMWQGGMRLQASEDTIQPRAHQSNAAQISKTQHFPPATVNRTVVQSCTHTHHKYTTWGLDYVWKITFYQPERAGMSREGRRVERRDEKRSKSVLGRAGKFSSLTFFKYDGFWDFLKG